MVYVNNRVQKRIRIKRSAFVLASDRVFFFFMRRRNVYPNKALDRRAIAKRSVVAQPQNLLHQLVESTSKSLSEAPIALYLGGNGR